MTATQLGSTALKGTQTVTRGATETFTRFVEGDEYAAAHPAGAHSGSNVPPEKKDFWDSFGGATKAEPAKKDFWDAFGVAGEGPGAGTGAGAGTVKKGGAIGTAAMKGAGAGGEREGEWKDDEW